MYKPSKPAIDLFYHVHIVLVIMAPLPLSHDSHSITCILSPSLSSSSPHPIGFITCSCLSYAAIWIFFLACNRPGQLCMQWPWILSLSLFLGCLPISCLMHSFMFSPVPLHPNEWFRIHLLFEYPFFLLFFFFLFSFSGARA